MKNVYYFSFGLLTLTSKNLLKLLAWITNCPMPTNTEIQKNGIVFDFANELTKSDFFVVNVTFDWLIYAWAAQLEFVALEKHLPLSFHLALFRLIVLNLSFLAHAPQLHWSLPMYCERLELMTISLTLLSGTKTSAVVLRLCYFVCTVEAWDGS